MLLHTEFTRLMTGDFSVMSFESGRRVLFFLRISPTVLFVAVFVGLLAKESAVPAAAVAVLPVSLVSSGTRLAGTWRMLMLVLCTVLLTLLCQRLRRRLWPIEAH